MKKKRFDATTRILIEMGPADWAGFLGSAQADPEKVSAIDSNLSTVTAEADKVLWIDAPSPGSSMRSSRRAGTHGSTTGPTCTVPC